MKRSYLKENHMFINKKNVQIKSMFYLLAVCSVLINACVRVYNTSDEKKNFSKMKKQVDNNINKAEIDKVEKQAGFDQLISNISDSNMEPYPQLEALLGNMSLQLTSLHAFQTQQEDIRTEFETFAKGKKKIESNNKSDWGKLHKIREKYQKAMGNMQSILQRYSESSNSFISLANQYKIRKVNVSDIQKQIDANLANLDKGIDEINKHIAESRGILKNVKNQDKNKEKIEQKEKILNKLEKIVEDISALRKELSSLIEDFTNEVGNKTEMWSGPGMRTHTIINDITKIGKKINKKRNKFNEIAKTL